jgi:cell shape-determining protein MreC
MEVDSFIDLITLEKISLIGVLLAFLIYFVYRVEKCTKQHGELLGDALSKNTEAFLSLQKCMQDVSENLKHYRSDSSAEHTKLMEKFGEVRIEIAKKIISRGAKQ